MASAVASTSSPKAVVHISKKEWDKGLAAVKVSKDDLNRIVLDYLIIEGYRDAAIEFAKEAGLDPRIDYESIQERMLIREAVESGRVEEAVRRVNELDSEILDTNAPLLFHLHLQVFIELIRHSQIPEALSYASTELAPRGAHNPEFLSELERTMALLAFPELAAMAEDAPTPLGANPPAGAGKQELNWASLGSLMQRDHRTKVAKELNAAILESQGQGQETRLGGLVRLMSWGEGQLDSKGVVVPGINVSSLLQMGAAKETPAAESSAMEMDQPMVAT